MKPFVYFLLLIAATSLQAKNNYIDTKNPNKMFLESLHTTYEMTKIVDPKLWTNVSKWQDYFEQEVKKQSEKTPTFFYLFTLGDESSNRSHGVNHFARLAFKLKEKYPSIRFYAVLNGFPKESAKLTKLLEDEKNDGFAARAGLKVKFLSTMYSELNITEAPAYIFGDCQENFGADYGCDMKYIARGQIGLDGFLELMRDDNKTYKEWHNALREAN